MKGPRKPLKGTAKPEKPKPGKYLGITSGVKTDARMAKRK